MVQLGEMSVEIIIKNRNYRGSPDGVLLNQALEEVDNMVKAFTIFP